MQKGKKFFNIIIIIITLALISAVGYIAYYYISDYISLKEAEQAVDEYEKQVIVVEFDENQQNNNEQVPNEPNEQQTTTSSTKKSSGVYYKNYSMIGTIHIPKTRVKIPIVDKVTTQSIVSAAAVLYGPGLNEIGNTVIVGHNYRNGTYFSNNKKLELGDKIYIVDSTGNKVEYMIYNKYETLDTDFSYATRNTEGKREISISTCTTDASKRLVIWAKET